MSHNTQTSTTDFSYIAVLLLLAYVMSSAPRYIRNFHENHNDIKIEKVSPVKQVLKYTKFYAVDPYLKAFNQLTQPKAGSNLAAVNGSILR